MRQTQKQFFFGKYPTTDQKSLKTWYNSPHSSSSNISCGQWATAQVCLPAMRRFAVVSSAALSEGILHEMVPSLVSHLIVASVSNKCTDLDRNWRACHTGGECACSTHKFQTLSIDCETFLKITCTFSGGPGNRTFCHSASFDRNIDYQWTRESGLQCDRTSCCSQKSFHKYTDLDQNWRNC